MKQKTKLTVIVSVVAVTVICAAVLIAAASLGDKPTAVLEYIVGISDECPEYADANGDGKVNVLDVIALVNQKNEIVVELSTLTLDDDAYTLELKDGVLAYTVKLPAGRPNIPRVAATAADGVELEISQAVIPDSRNYGYATVKATDSENQSNTYSIRFEKDIAEGFVLQYDDRYTFAPNYTLQSGESFTFESNNESVVTVGEDGLMTAKAVSAEPVTVTAKVGDSVKDTLVIDRVEKAHINLFLVTGQSNAQGCYANSTANDAELLAAQLANVEAIGQDGIIYSYDFHPRSSNTEVYALRYTLYDMNTVAKQGFQNSLGKKWYELSGEKVVFLQTAYSGAPIQSWLDTETQPEAGKYGGRNFYDDTQKAYADLIPLLADNYEIIRTANFWNQGGTAMASIYSHSLGNYINSGDEGFDPSKLMTDEEYYELFMLMHNDMKKDFGIEFCGIFLNRVTPGATSSENKALQSHTDMVPIRSAQYGLHNTVPEVSLVSRVGDYAKRTTWQDKTDPGWGFVDSDNTHFTQIGYNERGRVAAEAAFEIWLGDTAAESVEIVAQNGRDRLTAKDTIEIKEGEEYRLAGYALPMGAGAKTTLTSSNPAVASVDKYGVVTGHIGGNAVITATTENGKTESVNVVVYKVIQEEVTYHWDFNDLTSSMADNDLTVSAGSVYHGTDKNYTLTDGTYKLVSGTTTYTRPDFTFENPITLNSESDWTIEWKGLFKSTSTLIGPAHTDYEGNVTKNGFIYNGYSANFGSDESPLYPLRWVPETGSELKLSFGDYKSYNSKTNSWRLSYDSSANMMSLWVYDSAQTMWVKISEAKAGTFSTTFYTLFGRMRGNGYLNFYGEMEYVKIDCKIESAIKGENYYWDFKDLTSSSDKNDLTLSECADYYGAGSKYTLNEGVYVLDKTLGKDNAERTDFTFEKPFTLNSDNDWTIEWKGYTYNSSCVLMGQAHDDPTGNTTKNGYIYLASASDFDYSAEGKLFPLRWVPETGSALSLSYGDYKSSNYKMNSWRLSYTASTNKMSLLILVRNENGTETWKTISSATAGTFSTNFKTLFGRMRGNGYLNYYGQMDYVKVNFTEVVGETSAKVEYLWDFNDLTSSSEKNDLTVSDCAAYYEAEKNYELVVTPGTYTVNKYQTGNYSERPDFSLEKSINLTSEKSWVIEWRGKIYSTACLLFGPDQTDPASSTTLYDFIYLAYTTNFGSSTNKWYPIRFTTGSKTQLYLKYGDYKNLNTYMNSWRLVYNKETNVMALYCSVDEGTTWQLVYSLSAGTFDVTYNNLFGRMKGNGNYNYYGQMEYVQVAIEK